MSVKAYHNHYHFSYTTSFKRHFSSLALVLLILILILSSGINFLTPRNTIDFNQLSLRIIFASSLNTLLRLSVAYFFSLLLSVPLALLITKTKKLEKILLPIVDIIQSVPILAFFPIIVLVFVKINFFNGAAIFILFMSMIWNIVFSVMGGLKTIPQDVESAAEIFKASGINKLWFVTLPSIFPSIITGSFLAWGQGWNISIVAEALHNYIPNGSKSQDLFGLGSLLVNSFSEGKSSVFFASLIAMIIIISLLNLFVWQRLLHVAERYKFD